MRGRRRAQAKIECFVPGATGTLAGVIEVYNGSNGEATKALYETMSANGPAGVIATNVFRAVKCSARAKVYRGGNGHGSYRDQAYERKQWSIRNLCEALRMDASLVLSGGWGWGIDEQLRAEGSPHYHVLYVDLPTGQVSFHTDQRESGPDYGKPWDGVRGKGPERVCRWCADILEGWAHWPAAPTEEVRVAQ